MKFKTRKRLMAFPSIRPTRHWMKRVTLHRYGNISLYKFFGIFFHNIHEDEVFDRSNAVAYNFLLAIFPAMIFLFTLIPYITTYIPDVSNESIMQFLGEMMPS